MAISGLVITLSQDSAARRRTLDALRADPRLALGAMEGPRLPVVLDTPSPHDDRDAYLWLGSLPGVEAVDLVYVHLDGAAGAAEGTP